MLPTSETSDQPESYKQRGLAFQLSVECEPLIVERGRNLKITISSPSDSILPVSPSVIEIKDASGKTFYKRTLSLRSSKHRSQIIRFKVDTSMAPGQYAVHAYFEDSRTASLVTFELVMPSFSRNTKKLQAALRLRQEAVTLRERNNLRASEQTLIESARIVSSLGCFELASSTLRDLAALQLSSGSEERAKQSIRAGLLNVLRAANTRAVIGKQKKTWRSSYRKVLAFSELQIPSWQVLDFFELLDKTQGRSALAAYNTSVSGVVRDVLCQLVDLGESSPFFVKSLEASIGERPFSDICYLGLSKCNPTKAVRLIPKLIAALNLQKDLTPDSPTMRVVIDSTRPVDLYRSLPKLLQRLDKEKRKPFLNVLQLMVPARCIFSDEQWLVFFGQETNPAVVLRNTHSNFQSILPSVSIATYGEAEEKAMSAKA